MQDIIIDVSIFEADLDLELFFPLDILREIDSYLFRYDLQSSAPELLAMSNQTSIVRWILEENRWSQEEISSCIDCCSCYVSIDREEQDDRLELFDLLTEYSLENPSTVSFNRLVYQGAISYVQILFERFEWDNYTLSKILRTANNENMIYIIVDNYPEFDNVDMMILIDTRKMTVRIMDLLLEKYEWNGWFLHSCLVMIASQGNLSLAETLLNHGVDPFVWNINDLDREMTILIKSYF